MSVLIDKALKVIRLKLKEDNSLKERTLLVLDYLLPVPGRVLSSDPQYCHGIPHVTHCVQSVYGVVQTETACSGYSTTSTQWWRLYVDDAHTIIKKTHSQEFTDHLNSTDDEIQWTW